MTAAVPFLYARGGSLFALSALREALSLLVGGVEEEGMKLFLRRTCKEAEVELHVAAEVDRMAPLNVDWTREDRLAMPPQIPPHHPSVVFLKAKFSIYDDIIPIP